MQLHDCSSCKSCALDVEAFLHSASWPEAAAAAELGCASLVVTSSVDSAVDRAKCSQHTRRLYTACLLIKVAARLAAR